MQKLIKGLCNVHLDKTTPYSDQHPDLRQIVITKVYAIVVPLSRQLTSIGQVSNTKTGRIRERMARYRNDESSLESG